MITTTIASTNATWPNTRSLWQSQAQDSGGTRAGPRRLLPPPANRQRAEPQREAHRSADEQRHQQVRDPGDGSVPGEGGPRSGRQDGGDAAPRPGAARQHALVGKIGSDLAAGGPEAAHPYAAAIADLAGDQERAVRAVAARGRQRGPEREGRGHDGHDQDGARR